MMLEDFEAGALILILVMILGAVLGSLDKD